MADFLVTAFNVRQTFYPSKFWKTNETRKLMNRHTNQLGPVSKMGAVLSQGQGWFELKEVSATSTSISTKSEIPGK
jgi:hypothetical protein